jgi:protein-L-isoaspartate(D-aspartate) O-methyltransferase
MSPQSQLDHLAEKRERMVQNQLRARGITNPPLLQAMARVPRHEFVSPEDWDRAYDDCPIPIGAGQTISQPYIVAAMIDVLDLPPERSVLEIGAGSGYLSAIIAELSCEVWAVERIPELARNAALNLARLGYHHIHILEGDGTLGLPEHAPYNAIIVSAAAPSTPRALFSQLAEGGRMVVPVGPAQAQQLQLIEKHGREPLVRLLDYCRFVPLIGQQGYQSGWDR